MFYIGRGGFLADIIQIWQQIYHFPAADSGEEGN